MLYEKLDKIKERISPLQYNIITYLKNDAKTRKEISHGLNIPWTTLYDNLFKLEKKRIVYRRSKHNGVRGRPLKLWQLKQAYDLTLFKLIRKKIGVVGSGEYKKKKLLFKNLKKWWIKKEI